MAFNNQGIGGGSLGVFRPSALYGQYQQPQGNQPQGSQPQGNQFQTPNTFNFGNPNSTHQAYNSFFQAQREANPNNLPYINGMPSWLTQNRQYFNNLMSNRPNNQLFASMYGNQF